MENMRRCVVILLDLVGMKGLLADDNKRRQAIDAMEALDRVCNDFSRNRQHIDHVYCWNDSVLLLAYLQSYDADLSALAIEVSRFKESVDTQCHRNSFIAMVKGKSFMPNDLQFRVPVPREGSQDPVYHYLLASSMAFANCEKLVKKFRKDHHDWYVDQRIRDQLSQELQGRLIERGRFKAFPRMKVRKVYTAEGYLHS
jgi:hypothetical protein